MLRTITLCFCCFTASIDVYGTHSNVHLRCFHTGKSAVTHATPKVSSVATRRHRLVLCPHLPPWLNLPSFRVRPFFVITVCLVLFFLFCIICDAEVRRSSVVSVCLCSLSFKNSFVWQIYLSCVNIVGIVVKGCAHVTHWMSGLGLHFCSQSFMNI